MASTPLYPSISNPEHDNDIDLASSRISNMMLFRVNCHGINIEDVWRWADMDYRLVGYQTMSNRYDGLSVNDRDNRLKIGNSDWQSDNSSAETFTKIQTALSMLFDRNPESWCEAKNPKGFGDLAKLASAALDDSHDREVFRNKLKFYVQQLAKYGYSPARVYVKHSERTVYDNVSDEQGNVTEQKREITNDEEIFQTLSPWNVWVDEQTQADAPYETCNDWCWREVYSDEKVLSEFGDTAEVRAALKRPKGMIVAEYYGRTVDAGMTRKDLNELFFYENRQKDQVLVFCNGLLILKGRLARHKELSLLVSIWNIRDKKTIYGVGIPEILRQNKNLFDKIRNMNIDQTALSVYSMFFYDPTLQTEDSDMTVAPGVGYKSMSPDKIQWMRVPAPDAASIERERMLKDDMDEDTGVGKALNGSMNVDPRMPASYLSTMKEANLQKLRTPLDFLLHMLEREAMLRWSLIQEINRSKAEISTLMNPEEIAAFLKDYADFESLYSYDAVTGSLKTLTPIPFKAGLTYRNGKLIKSEERNFFYWTIPLMEFNGLFHFRAEAVLVYNRELEKQMKLDVANLVLPLLTGDPRMYKPAVMQILRIYHEDPQDWLPPSWLALDLEAEEVASSAVQAQPTAPMAPQEAQRVVPQRETAPDAGSFVDKEMRRTIPRDTRPNG